MLKTRLSRLSRARAMKCFGKLIEQVELDPTTQDKLTEEFNCKTCDNYMYCCKLADTLEAEPVS